MIVIIPLTSIVCFECSCLRPFDVFWMYFYAAKGREIIMAYCCCHSCPQKKKKYPVKLEYKILELYWFVLFFIFCFVGLILELYKHFRNIMLFWNILPFLYTLSLIFWIFHKKTLSIGPSFRTKYSTTEEHLSGLEAAQKFSSFFVAKATTSPWNKASQDWRKRVNGSHCCHHLLLGLRNALCEDLAREFQPQAKGWLEWCDVNEFIICCLCVYIT